MEDAQLIEPNHRPNQAFAIFAVSVALGLLGNLFFHHYYPLGLNIPLFMLLFWGAAAALIRQSDKTIAWKNALFLIPVFFYSTALAVLDSPVLIFLNLSLLFMVFFLSIRFLLEPRFLGGSWLMPLISGFQFVMMGWLESVIWVLFGSGEWLQSRQKNFKNAETVNAVIRGLVITVPIVIVLAILLGSADVVFGDLLEGALSWIKIENWDVLFTHLFLTGFFAALSMIALKTMLVGQILNIEPREPQGSFFHLSMIETGMLLGSVDLLFLAFVMVQGAYFFGGE